MRHRNYCVISGILFSLVAIAHLYRVLTGTTVLINDMVVPMWISWVAIAVPGVLAAWAFRLARA